MPPRPTFALLVLALLAPSRPDGDAPAPIPDPPRQGEPWTPPPGGPPGAVAKAADRLFALGMADPRGCSYREVVIRLRYRNSGQDQSIATHAWAFPEADDAPEHFAIAPDGQVYPAEVGGPADLRADVEAGLQALGKAADPNAPYVPPLEASLRADRVTPLRAVQVLRAGEADLARRVWEATAKDLPPDPFPVLAAHWAGALYDQTRFAHARGEDRLALAGARRQAKALPTLRPLAPPPPENGVGMWAGGPFTSTLDFLDEVPRLLADQERRARESPRPYDPKAPQVERIAALIDGFDEIAVVQMSNPGGVYLGESGVVQALIDEGEPAIDPLLDELGRPERLTRSVEASRSLGGGRRFLGTSGAAAAALRELLDRAGVPGMTQVTIERMSPEERRAVAKALRKAWHAVKDVPPAERWYRDLADDAKADRWAAAVGNIVSPVDRRAAYRRPADPHAARRGDPLRDGRAPGVSELIARRVADEARGERLREATGLALGLSAWDPEAARPVLAEQMERVRAASLQKASAQPDGFDWDLAQDFLSLARRRIALGDADAALDAYAGWLVSVPRSSQRGSTLDFFALAWTHPDHPKIASAVDAMFNLPTSSWVPMVELRPGSSLFELDGFLASPLIGLAGYRKALVRALVDDRLIGTASLEEGGLMRYTLKNGGQGSGGPFPFDPEHPGAVPEAEMRARDYVAWKLAAHPGFAPCMPYWGEEKKAATIKGQIRFLDRYGERFADATRALDPEHPASIFDKTGPALPSLDHPATPGDVEEGRAIFSLAGEGREVRVVPLPARLLEARWTALKSYPFLQERFYTDGRRETVTAYLQEGQVWQAEEVLEDGAWTRYLGFAGPGIARVPAGEIELTGDTYHWRPWNDRLDLQLAWPIPPEGREAFAVGEPVVATLSIRNRTGLDCAAPTELVRRLDDGSVALRGGLRLTLERSDLDPLGGGLPMSGESRPAPRPSAVLPRSDAHFEPAGDEPTRTLTLGDSFEAARIDVRDLFAMDRPGRYQLQLWIDGEDGPPKWPSASVGFVVAEEADAPRPSSSQR